MVFKLTTMKTKKCKMPLNNMIESSLQRNDYWDSYSVEVPFETSNSLERLPVLFFKVFPGWFKALMYLREIIAKAIGLKTADGMDIKQELKSFRGEVGQSIAIFNVLGRSDTEILTGESDSHLDFRLSYFAIPKGKNKTELNLTTTVEFNNWLGRLYFIPAGIVHRIAMPLVLKRMAEELIRLKNKEQLRERDV